MDDKIIEKLNIITKIWQLEVATQHVLKGFISSRVIRGSALVEMSGENWLQWVQCEPKIKVCYLTPL